MTASIDRSEEASAHPMQREVRLTLDISLSPDQVDGRLSAADGQVTTFEGWLGLAQAVAAATGEGAIAGAALLGEGRLEDRGETDA